MRNTFYFVAGTTVFLNLFGLGLALFLNNSTRFTHLVRTLVFIPVLLSPVIVGVMWWAPRTWPCFPSSGPPSGSGWATTWSST
jgi:ABC-type sulfate transport system permease component